MPLLYAQRPRHHAGLQRKEVDVFKTKPIDTPRAETDPMYKGTMWGPFSWGHDEFTNWFGINLPRNRGFYGLLRDHA